METPFSIPKPEGWIFMCEAESRIRQALARTDVRIRLPDNDKGVWLLMTVDAPMCHSDDGKILQKNMRFGILAKHFYFTEPGYDPDFHRHRVCAEVLLVHEATLEALLKEHKSFELV